MIFSGFQDFRKSVSTSGGGFTSSQINVIEQNIENQIDVPIGHIDIEWVNGIPINIKKYVSSDKVTMIYNIDLTWSNGVPITIVSNNLSDGTTVSKSITWANGVPVSIDKGAI